MTRPKFANGHIYHIFNRGTDKRDVFMEIEDYSRFLYALRDFNDKNSSINLHRQIKIENNSVSVGHPMSNMSNKIDDKDKDPLVKFHCSCLMPNHYHFILEQLVDDGISKFMQKLGIGYTKYFNEKYERSGVLFQGKFKAILIDRDEYLNWLKQYIYFNPLDLFEPGWKENGLSDWRAAKRFLEEYRWINRRNFDNYDDFLKSCENSNRGKNAFDLISDLMIEK